MTEELNGSDTGSSKLPPPTVPEGVSARKTADAPKPGALDSITEFFSTFWSKLKKLGPDGWPLTSRLIVIIASQVILATLLSGTINVLSLKDTMQQQLDEQLNTAMVLAARQQETGRVDPGDGFILLPGLATGTLGVIVHNGEVIRGEMIGPVGSSVALNQETVALLTSLTAQDTPITVQFSNLGSYRLGLRELGTGANLIIGLSVNDMNRTLGRQQAYVVFIAVTISTLSALLAFFLVRWNLRPLRRVAQAAQEISQMRLDKGEVELELRLDASDLAPTTEVGQVGYAFQMMLENVHHALQVRQRSEQQVREFVADASHELRTPLAAIRGYAELTGLQDKNLNPEVKYSIDRIESEAMRMTQLVEELLLLASLDANRPMEQELVELSPALEAALNDASAISPSHNWVFEKADQPVQVIADPIKIHQMVANLLANARLHTPEGTTVTLRVKQIDSPTDEEHVQAVIEVEDNGPGIPEAFQEKMFQRFMRGDSSRSRQTGSTGLGLSIVHAIATAHKGTIMCESRPGKTLFRITLNAVTVEEH